jgi:hypothetical protein
MPHHIWRYLLHPAIYGLGNFPEKRFQIPVFNLQFILSSKEKPFWTIGKVLDIGEAYWHCSLIDIGDL